MKYVCLLALWFAAPGHAEAAIGISVPLLTGRTGDTLEVPIQTTAVPESTILACQFTLKFSSGTLTGISSTSQGTLAGQAGWAVAEFFDGDSVTIGAYGSKYLSGSGTIIKLRFRVKGFIGGNSPLTLRRFMYNAGSPAVTMTNGAISVTASVDDHAPSLPAGTVLLQNYPNPFNPSTTIPYVLESAGHVRITVHSSLGQEVRTLIDEHQEAGVHHIGFSGPGLSSGVYFTRMRSGSRDFLRTMILMK